MLGLDLKDAVGLPVADHAPERPTDRMRDHRGLLHARRARRTASAGTRHDRPEASETTPVREQHRPLDPKPAVFRLSEME